MFNILNLSFTIELLAFIYFSAMSAPLKLSFHGFMQCPRYLWHFSEIYLKSKSSENGSPSSETLGEMVAVGLQHDDVPDPSRHHSRFVEREAKG